MNRRAVTLLRVAGIPIRIDPSWIFIAALVTWSLAAGLFAQTASAPLLRWILGDLADAPAAVGTRWLMGAAGALGLFASILFHELSHSLVARSHGITIRGITLFIFGGVAEMEEEPKRAGDEFKIAIVGPIASLVLAGAGLGVRVVLGDVLPAPVMAVVSWLAFTNLVLAVFNMIPGFPLDGGRVLRSILWASTGNLKWATRMSSLGGRVVAWLLMLLGVAQFFSGNYVGGVWSFLIGTFLNAAAKAPYQQLLARQALEGVPVRQLMRSEPITVPRAISVTELVNDYIYRHQFKMLPVVDGGRLLGCVTLQHVKDLPRDEWASTSVGAITEPCGDGTVITPDTDALDALARMGRGPTTRLMVVENEQLVGVISLRDLLSFLALRMELDSK